jgi:4-hydroxythreonine-4-phosphate dehydrogenase
MKKFHRVAITTGDKDGIGSEVTAKALSRLKAQRGLQLYLWRSPSMAKRELRLIDRYYRRHTVKTWPEALKVPVTDHKQIIDIESHLPPARWVETMAHAGHSKMIDALVTAPLSKTEIVNCGMRDNGHTGILKRITKTKNVFMCFLGKQMNVTLLTGHSSPKKAYDSINQDLIEECIALTSKVVKVLPTKLHDKPIGVVGCSPHAGEEGVIDNKEIQVYKPAIKRMRQRRIKLSDPLIPDVCFQESERKKFSFYIASFHDQGLIPFKMLHGTQSGVQYSLGLPFIRTSVDHGTAKDIFGKNKANSGSMEQALKVAIRMLKNKQIVW